MSSVDCEGGICDVVYRRTLSIYKNSVCDDNLQEEGGFQKSPTTYCPIVHNYWKGQARNCKALPSLLLSDKLMILY